MSAVSEELVQLLKASGASSPYDLSIPPKTELGDFAFACFSTAKEVSKSPVAVAELLASEIRQKNSELVDRVEAFGPYVNFFLNPVVAAKRSLEAAISKEWGRTNVGHGKKIMVEFAHPNTHKAFHVGHLRNITTGESLVRILENAGYLVTRANYQGDVGLHIAKCLYGIMQMPDYKEKMSNLRTLDEKAEFLGAAYSSVGKVFADDTGVQAGVADMNKKIYEQDKEVMEIYSTTRQWSLDYFENNIYKRVGTRFDRYYFESEVADRGVEIVKTNTPKIFHESQGAVIFPGSDFGLHDRVFLNSQGFPTYEAKEMALAELEFNEFKPEHIYHVVGKEQSEYFKVVFKALEQVMPASLGKETHLAYGWLQLKGTKMSSRTGNVLLAEWLIEEVKKQISEVVQNGPAKDKDETAERIAIAAIKYALLKTGVGNDIAFDINESVSLTGDSGPYLLYVCSRIKSILKKSGATVILSGAKDLSVNTITPEEKSLALEVGRFADITTLAATTTDPSQIARYLFGLSQKFNNFYHACPVLTAEGETKAFRLALISAVLGVLEHGLYLLGIQTVEEM